MVGDLRDVFGQPKEIVCLPNTHGQPCMPPMAAGQQPSDPEQPTQQHHANAEMEDIGSMGSGGKKDIGGKHISGEGRHGRHGQRGRHGRRPTPIVRCTTEATSVDERPWVHLVV